MPYNLDEMISKGVSKLRAKESTITARWNAAKPKMKEGYNALPFGPLTKAAYNAAIDAATHRVDPDKWARNYRFGVTK